MSNQGIAPTLQEVSNWLYTVAGSEDAPFRAASLTQPKDKKLRSIQRRSSHWRHLQPRKQMLAIRQLYSALTEDAAELVELWRRHPGRTALDEGFCREYPHSVLENLQTLLTGPDWPGHGLRAEPLLDRTTEPDLTRRLGELLHGPHLRHFVDAVSHAANLPPIAVPEGAFIEIERGTTRILNKRVCRTDLAISWSQGRERHAILIEFKFGAKLLDHQLPAYLQTGLRMVSDQANLHCFLITLTGGATPHRNWHHLHMHQVLAAWEAVLASVTTQPDHRLAGLRRNLWDKTLGPATN